MQNPWLRGRISLLGNPRAFLNKGSRIHIKMFSKFKNYIIEARHELRNVQWPTRNEAAKLTAVVVGVSLALSVFLGVFDTFFSYVIKVFVLKS